jgi:hypothetical protein
MGCDNVAVGVTEKQFCYILNVVGMLCCRIHAKLNVVDDFVPKFTLSI